PTRRSSDLVQVSDDFIGKVWNTGVMRHNRYFTIESIPYGDGLPIPLGKILQEENKVDKRYYLTDEKRLAKFKYLRGPKKIERTDANGHVYTISAGSMSPYEDINKPARTMLTSEGSTNRSTHFLNINGNYRLLTPIEAERLVDFPDDWTKYKLTNKGEVKEVTDRMRLFFMGNALVTNIVKRIGKELYKLDTSIQYDFDEISRL